MTRLWYFYLVSYTGVMFCYFHFYLKLNQKAPHSMVFLSFRFLFFDMKRLTFFKRCCFCQSFLKPLYYLFCTKVCHYVMIQWWYDYRNNAHSYLQPVIVGHPHLIYYISWLLCCYIWPIKQWKFLYRNWANRVQCCPCLHYWCNKRNFSN